MATTSDTKFSDISIIHKTYKFYLTLYGINQFLPKKDRYTLGIKSENLTMEILEMLYEANSKSGAARLELLEKIDLKLKILQAVIRLCLDSKALDQNKYLNLQTPLQEIGKMLGGWIKTTRKD